ncbi:F0F1 ATP synthase subunit gamma [Erysipelothrix urinaevulpis]|uniref:F0F1 ATP synthase subunit gamma n=1 Tax=Erysipelothrix urinaevulpis TaxID=2683717 RepID=UPI001915F240|nr:FoF1 ATP synthase subunit gamma [Erysipelothrix urinaevulpis]
MASNTAGIKQRINSITSTQKITKAMKLVSLSKLQKYRRYLNEFEPYFEAVSGVSDQFLPFEKEHSDLDKLYVIFMPDLGLCSAYTQGLMKQVLATIEDGDEVLTYGTQFHDLMIKKGIPIINDAVSSERLDLDEIVKEVSTYIGKKNIITIIPEYKGSVEMMFNHYPLWTQIKDQRDDVIYEPNFEETSKMLVKQTLNSLIRYSFLMSKVSEHTTRRIAMEKATDSAQDMIEELQRSYNQARQEAITQEISEIVSGMEVS